MTKEDIEVLKTGNDLMASAITGSINQSKSQEEKKQGREMLKKVLDVSDKIDLIEIQE